MAVDLQVVAGRVRSVRRALDLTQEEFARRVGCSQRAVQSWEAGLGEPRVQFRRRLAGLASMALEQEVTPAWFRVDEGVAAA